MTNHSHRLGLSGETAGANAGEAAKSLHTVSSNDRNCARTAAETRSRQHFCKA